MTTRLLARRFLATLIVTVAASMLAGPVYGQAVWSGGGSNGNWSNSANWSVQPASGNTETVRLQGTSDATTGSISNIYSVIDLASPFDLKSLTYNTAVLSSPNNTSTGFVIGGSTLLDFNASGTGSAITVSNNLSLTTYLNGTSSPTGTLSPTGPGALVINAPVKFDAVNTTISSSATSNTSGAFLIFGGAISGSGNLIISGSASSHTVAITSANNTYSGSITVNQGNNLYLAANNAVSRGTIFNISGGNGTTSSFLSTSLSSLTDINGGGAIGYNQQIGGIAQPFTSGQATDSTSLGELAIGLPNGGAGTTLLGFATGATAGGTGNNGKLLSTTFATAGSINIAAGSHLGIVGGLIINFTDFEQSMNGSTSIRNGTLWIYGDGTGVYSPQSGNLPNNSVYADGVIDLDNSSGSPVNNRFSASSNTVATGATGTLRMAGGTLRMEGFFSTVNTAPPGSTPSFQTFGTLIVRAGQSTIAMNSPNNSLSASFAGLSTTDLARGGQVVIVGDSLGSSSNTQLFIVGTSAPAAGIVPWALGQSNFSGTAFVGSNDGSGPPANFTEGAPVTTAPNTLVTYNSTTGFVPLTSFDGTSLTGSTSTQNINLTSATNAPGTAASANSIVINATAATVTLTGGLTLTSGALLSNATTASFAGTGTLNSGNTLYISPTASGDTLTIGVGIAAPNLSKGGAGTLTLTSGLMLSSSTPILAVNAGTLNLAGLGAVTSSTGITLQVAKYSTVVAPTAGLTLASAANGFGSLIGAGTVTGSVTVGSGGVIQASGLGGGGTLVNGESGGILNLSGALTLNAGSKVSFIMSSVLGGSTIIGPTGTGSGTYQSYTQGYISSTATLVLGTNVTAGSVKIAPLAIDLKEENYLTTGVYDFNAAQSYTWAIGKFSAITNFNAADFVVDVSAFDTALSPSAFSVSSSLTNPGELDLVYTPAPVPEPALIGLAVFGVLAVARRRKSA